MHCIEPDNSIINMNFMIHGLQTNKNFKWVEQAYKNLFKCTCITSWLNHTEVIYKWNELLKQMTRSVEPDSFEPQIVDSNKSHFE